MKYDFDSISITRDGKRWFPTMGEIHYSRVAHSFWKDEINKMKSCGVDIISTYVIWIHHGEIEGEYDWSGDKNLCGFIQAAKDCGVKVCLRIGPWCHGEVRNGGFPDWLLKKDFEVRTNDERYLSCVEKWYKQIFSQVKKFFSGGENPIIAVQIENEYGHCGGLSDETGDAHMRRLQAMAKEIGFDVPLWTATGWGGARTGGMLPVMGGYCDAPWDQRVTEIEPSGNYIFTHERNDHNIGSDHGFGYGITFDTKKFPYLTAELGGGLQVTSHRRTVARAEDIAAVALVKLGSGVSLLGYYMFHGGTNPDGKLSTLQESRETGYLNDLPVKNYDFRAPVGEYGVVTETARELKLLSYFTGDFGSELCALAAVIPEENPSNPEDTTHLRYSFRTDGKKGFLFVNNYVRHQKMASHKIEIKTPDNSEVFALDIKDGDFYFLPFNMEFGGVKVKKAFATPFCRIGSGADEKFFFYARKNETPDRIFFEFDESCRGTDKIAVLRRTDALNAWKVSDGGRLVICGGDCAVYEDERKKIVLEGTSDGEIEFLVYPDFECASAGFEKCGEQNMNIDSSLGETKFTKYRKRIDVESGIFDAVVQPVAEDSVKVKLDFSAVVSKIGKDFNDVFVEIDYAGESAKLFVKDKNGKRTLIADHFFMGEDYPWKIGLKKFAESEFDFSEAELEIRPLRKNAEIYIEKWPEINGEKIAAVNSIRYSSQWRIVL